MKKLICAMLLTAMLIMAAGCVEAPEAPAEPAEPVGGDVTPPPSEDVTLTLAEFLTYGADGEYVLSEDLEADLTGVDVAGERTVLLSGAKLTLTGTLKRGSAPITVRADGGGAAVLDLSGLAFEFDPSVEGALMEIHSGVELVPPAAADCLVVEQGYEWTSIRVVPANTSPVGGEPAGSIFQASAADELVSLMADGEVTFIELTNDITADLANAVVGRELTVNCAGHALTLTGELTLDGHMLAIEDTGGNGALDISGLFVSADASVSEGASGRTDLLLIRMNFKRISGEPTLPAGLMYEISGDGGQASIYMMSHKNSQKDAARDFALYLSGSAEEGLPSALPLADTEDGVLVLELDNPVIAEEIALAIEGGVTLKLKGSVTFDGGLYRFELSGGEGRVTVDMTELTVNATAEVGKTKSDNIVFWREREGVDLLYNESDAHLTSLLGGSGNNELRYVQ